MNNNNNKLNEKVAAKLKELEAESNNTQKLVRLTVEQMRELLLEGNGETVYHKIIRNIMDSRKALQKEVNEKFKESEIERFKKEIKHYMNKIETCIDGIELKSIDFVDIEVDNFMEKTKEYELKITELAVVENDYNILKEEYDELNNKYIEITKEFNDINIELNKKITIEGELQRKYSEKERETIELSKELSNNKTTYQEQINTLNEQINILNFDKTELIKEKNRIDLQYNEIAAREESVKAERDSYKDRNNQILDENKSLRDRVNILDAERVEKDKTVKELSDKNIELTNDLNTQKNTNAEQKRNHKEEINKLKTHYEGKLNTLTTNHKEEIKEKDKTIKSLQDVNEINEMLKNENSKNLEKLESINTLHEQTIKGIEEKHFEEVNRLKAEILRYQGVISSKDIEIDRLKAENKKALEFEILLKQEKNKNQLLQEKLRNSTK